MDVLTAIVDNSQGSRVARQKCTVASNGLVEFEMFAEPHVAAGDSILIDAYEPGEKTLG